MKQHKLNSISENLLRYDYFANEHDYIQITEWENGEGWDIDLNGKIMKLTHGELTAINHLTLTLTHKEK